MSKNTPKKDDGIKRFQVSKEEQEMLRSQQSVREHYIYLAGLIERDMRIYLETALRDKYAIGDDMAVAYDPATGQLLAMKKAKPEEKPTDAPIEQNNKN